MPGIVLRYCLWVETFPIGFSGNPKTLFPLIKFLFFIHTNIRSRCNFLPKSAKSVLIKCKLDEFCLFVKLTLVQTFHLVGGRAYYYSWRTIVSCRPVYRHASACAVVRIKYCSIEKRTSVGTGLESWYWKKFILFGFDQLLYFFLSISAFGSLM